MSFYKKAKDYLSGRSGRSQIVVKNAIGSFAIKIGSMFISFVNVPILLTFFDVSHYGVYLTISSIVAWTHQFDFGLGTGLCYKLTQSISLRDDERGKQLVSTAYISMSVIMLIVLMVSIPIFCYINWQDVLNCNFIAGPELALCVCLVLAIFVLQFVLDLISKVLQADQRAAISTIFKPIASLISLAIVILLRPYFYNSLIIACLALTVPIVFVLFVANVYCFKQKYKTISPAFSYFKRNCIKDIYSLGIKYFASQLSSLIVFTTASFLLSHYVNPAEAAVYNTAWAYFGIVVAFNVMVLQPLISAVTDAYVKNDLVWVKNIFKKISIYSAVLSILEILILVVSPLAFKIWLRGRMDIPTDLCIMMTVYFIFNVWVSPYSNFVGGVGKLNISVLLSVFKIIFFFPVAIFFIKMWSSPGLILAILTINTLPNLIVTVTQYYLIVNNKARGIWNK